MQTPAAEFIETARDELKDLPTDQLVRQANELHAAEGDYSTDFELGYMLGLQTARVMLQTMPAAVKAGVEL